MTPEPPAPPTESAHPAQPVRPTLLQQMGGVAGIVASTIPVVVFVIANVLLELRPAVIAALVSGVVIAGWRIARRQPLQPAVSGLFGVGIAAFLAYRSGEARAFYLPGLIYSAACGLAFLVSTAVRWPLAGVIWHGINGDGQGWRRDPRLISRCEALCDPIGPMALRRRARAVPRLREAARRSGAPSLSIWNACAGFRASFRPTASG